MIVIVVMIAVIFGIKILKSLSHYDPQTTALAKVKGEANAPVKIVEYIDLECPSCARGSKYLKDFMSNHPRLLHLEVKFFPLAMHPFGMLSAKYAECSARQGKFWEFIYLLMERQEQWSTLHDAIPAFEKIAKEVNLDLDKINVCLSDKTVQETIDANKREGKALDIGSTPTYLINGKMVVGTKSLDQELSKLLPPVENKH